MPQARANNTDSRRPPALPATVLWRSMKYGIICLGSAPRKQPSQRARVDLSDTGSCRARNVIRGGTQFIVRSYHSVRFFKSAAVRSFVDVSRPQENAAI